MSSTSLIRVYHTGRIARSRPTKLCPSGMLWSRDMRFFFANVPAGQYSLELQMKETQRFDAGAGGAAQPRVNVYVDGRLALRDATIQTQRPEDDFMALAMPVTVSTCGFDVRLYGVTGGLNLPCVCGMRLLDGNGEVVHQFTSGDSSEQAMWQPAEVDPESGSTRCTRYEELLHSGLPLGGIGTGRLELLTNGTLGSFSCANNWDVPTFWTEGSFFALWTNAGGSARAMMLHPPRSAGGWGLPTIDAINFTGRFPVAELSYETAGLPLDVRLRAQGTITPGSAELSSLPAATFAFTIRNNDSQPADVAVLASLENLCGQGGYYYVKADWSENVRERFDSVSGARQENWQAKFIKGLLFTNDREPRDVREANAFTDYALGCEGHGGVSRCVSWNAVGAGPRACPEPPSFWEEFAADGVLPRGDHKAEGINGKYRPAGAVAKKITIEPGKSADVVFVLSWYHRGHTTFRDGVDHGHAYQAQCKNVWETAASARDGREIAAAIVDRFHGMIRDSSLPAWLQTKLINGAFPTTTSSVWTADGIFSMHESPTEMAGAVGTIDQRLAAHPFTFAFFPELDRCELDWFRKCQQRTLRPHASSSSESPAHMPAELFMIVRAMMMVKTYAKFRELPITRIHAEGWLRRYLEKQRHGLTGYLENAGYPFNTPGWSGEAPGLKEHEQHWWPYEQIGYWVDGMVRCGHLLGDEYLLDRARKHFDHVLENADPDGYLGPKFMKQWGDFNRWPHAVFFRALMAHADATDDDGISAALARHYLSNSAPHSTVREACNIEAALWAYARTGDKRLLDHAVAAYDEFNRQNPKHDTSLKTMLSDKPGTGHGVTYNEMAKLGAILYICTGRRRLLDASVNAYRKLDRDHMLVDGVVSSTERLCGRDPLASHETCDIADYTWSVGYLLMATGRADYADKIERACLNAAPGAVRSDFKGLQYFSCPNQVVSMRSSNHNEFFRGSEWMSYRPNPGTECCPGEVNRIMPNFAARTWLSDGRGGLAAALYAPCRVMTTVGEHGHEVIIVEETQYPFSDTIDFRIHTLAPATFPLSLRIPGWCRGAHLLLNGQPMNLKCEPGTFVRIRREFRNNDRITLVLPMELKLSHWPRGGIAIERGPLVYSLKIEEDWQIDTDPPKPATKDFPAWNLFPASTWNYALCVDGKNLSKAVQVVHRPYTNDPWSIHTAPVELKVPARRVRGWKIERRKSVMGMYPNATFTGFEMVEKKGDFWLTPQLPDPATLRQRLADKVETVTLVPYGCTKLRVTIFPQGR